MLAISRLVFRKTHLLKYIFSRTLLENLWLLSLLHQYCGVSVRCEVERFGLGFVLDCEQSVVFMLDCLVVLVQKYDNFVVIVGD